MGNTTVKMKESRMKLVKLECHGCGAPIQYHGHESTLTCAYCGDVYGVPQEMRHDSEEVRRSSVGAPAYLNYGTSMAMVYGYNSISSTGTVYGSD